MAHISTIHSLKKSRGESQTDETDAMSVSSHGKLPMPPKRSAKSPPKTPPGKPAAYQQQQHVAPSSRASTAGSGNVRTYTCAFNAAVEERFNEWSTSMFASNIFLYEITAKARQEQRDRIREALEVEWRAAGLPVEAGVVRSQGRDHAYPVPARVSAAFDAFDIDHSGYIDQRELRAALRYYGYDECD